jgi:hypothetical protein
MFELKPRLVAGGAGCSRSLIAPYDAAMLKYLRIAVTALSLTACVLLIALWVRSYWWCDLISRMDANSQVTTLGSHRGTVYFVRMQLRGFGAGGPPAMGPRPQHGWRHSISEAHIANETFKLQFSGDSIFVLLPQWLVGPMFLAIGAAPCMPWSRRFSLRTLLIATTLVAVGLGIVVIST